MSLVSENATGPVRDVPNRTVKAQLDELVRAARDEQFEPGVESRFSSGLQRLCHRDPATVFELLKTKLLNRDMNSGILAESLRWVSCQDISLVRGHVFELLVSGLSHDSSLVRDTAASGLAWLFEDEALVPLQHALERESVPELKEDLENLVHSLER